MRGSLRVSFDAQGDAASRRAAFQVLMRGDGLFERENLVDLRADQPVGSQLVDVQQRPLHCFTVLFDAHFRLALRSWAGKLATRSPQFNGLASLLAGTDLVATVPDYAAAALAANGGVRAEPLPFETSQDFELSMAWCGAQDSDPAERWLRSRIQMFVGDPDSL